VISPSTVDPEKKTAPDFLTLGEVAQRMAVSSRTVLRWTSPLAGKDRLLAFKQGGIVRIRRTALDTWLKARERGA
jgi:excisionase family DNA binding protein